MCHHNKECEHYLIVIEKLILEIKGDINISSVAI